MKFRKAVLVGAVALMLGAVSLTGCVSNNSTAYNPLTDNAAMAGGVICIKVNPEIAVRYDANGLVTEVTARNPEAQAIVNAYTDYKGKGTKQVVGELITAIGNAGYYVDDVDGGTRTVTLEIENGSYVPSESFMNDVTEGAKATLSNNNWKGEVNTVDRVQAAEATTVEPTTVAPTTAEPKTTAAAPKPANTTKAKPKTTANKTTAKKTTGTTRKYVGTDYYNTDYGPYSDGSTDYGRSNYSDYGRSNYSDYGRTDY